MESERHISFHEELEKYKQTVLALASEDWARAEVTAMGSCWWTLTRPTYFGQEYSNIFVDTAHGSITVSGAYSPVMFSACSHRDSRKIIHWLAQTYNAWDKAKAGSGFSAVTGFSRDMALIGIECLAQLYAEEGASDQARLLRQVLKDTKCLYATDSHRWLEQLFAETDIESVLDDTEYYAWFSGEVPSRSFIVSLACVRRLDALLQKAL
jgi:hypothetical protein